MSNKLKVVVFAALLSSISSCSGKIYDYELERIALICGGYENIKKVWNDVTTARAMCADGVLVSAKD